MPHGNHLTKTAAGVVAVLFLFYWSVPSHPIDLGSVTPRDNVYRGAFHVHSIESDGGGTVEEIATAARASNLDFVILTDHGDGTESIPPRYIDDVLILAGVEISTDGGHYIAVGMPQAPYPLAGDPEGVVEDVRRFGGFGIIAHPYSAREELRWQDFTLPVDAIEWINGDSQWRNAGFLSLLSASLHYWFRPVGSLKSILHRPTDSMNMWDAMASNEAIVAFAGLDAHARLATGSGEEGYTGGFVFRFPWYADLFELFGIRVNLDGSPTGNADTDARNLLSNIKSGNFYSSVDGLATQSDFTFLGTLPDGNVIEMGETISSNQDLQLVANISRPSGAALRLLRNGTTVAESTNLEVTYTANSSDTPAVYRVEVYISGASAEGDVPWVVSNPIYFGSREIDSTSSMATAGIFELDPDAWRTEQHTDADVSLARNDDILTFGYALGNSPATYAAIAYDIESERISSDVFVEFMVRASKPMRISAQLRHGATGDNRWRDSFYADQIDRRVRISVRDFAPVNGQDSIEESVSAIDGFLFVIDTVNYQRNSSGEFQISGLYLGQE